MKKNLLQLFISLTCFLCASVVSASYKGKHMTPAEIKAALAKFDADFLKNHKGIKAANTHLENTRNALHKTKKLVVKIEKGTTEELLSHQIGTLQGHMQQLQMHHDSSYFELHKEKHVLHQIHAERLRRSQELGHRRKILTALAKQRVRIIKHYDHILLTLKKHIGKRKLLESKTKLLHLAPGKQIKKLQFLHPKHVAKISRLKAIERRLIALKNTWGVHKHKAENDFEAAKRKYMSSQKSWSSFTSWCKKTYHKAKHTVTHVAKKVYHKAKKVYNKAKKGVKSAVQKAKQALNYLKNKLKKAAKSVANRIIATWRQKITKKIIWYVATKGRKAYKMMSKGMASKLRFSLARGRDYESVRMLMMSQKKKQSLGAKFGKAALFKVAMAVTTEVLQVTLTCWSYSGKAKKACLTDDISRAFRDGSFSILSALISAAIGVAFIEPSSVTIASMVAAQLAAVTAGVGAASWPIVYSVTNIALSMAVWAIMSYLIKPQYDKFYNHYLMSESRVGAANIVKTLKGAWLECWWVGFTQSNCKSSYKGIR